MPFFYDVWVISQYNLAEMKYSLQGSAFRQRGKILRKSIGFHSAEDVLFYLCVVKC